MSDMDHGESILEYDDDISNTEAPEPLPSGTYPASVVQAVKRVSGAGNEYVAVSFMIGVDDYPADYPAENAPDGTTLVFRRVPYGQDRPAKYRMRRFCETIGAPLGARLDLSEWVGLTASLEVDHEEYEEETRAYVARVNKA